MKYINNETRNFVTGPLLGQLRAETQEKRDRTDQMETENRIVGHALTRFSVDAYSVPSTVVVVTCRVNEFFKKNLKKLFFYTLYLDRHISQMIHAQALPDIIRRDRGGTTCILTTKVQKKSRVSAFKLYSQRPAVDVLGD